MQAWIRGLGATALALGLAAAQAEVIYTALPTGLTTPSNSGGGANDGTGVWFNPLTGYAEVRGFLFPDPLFEDGKFLLLRDTVTYSQPQAQVWTEGLFARGNGVIYASPGNLNPARFGVGQVIGAGTGYQSPGAGFPDLGPAFGNWAGGGRGFLGLTLRDPSGSSANDIFYGYADITVNDDFSITLNAFAYENVRGASITTAVPEPGVAAMWLAGLAMLLRLGRQRRG